jgi:hypothetical protein
MANDIIAIDLNKPVNLEYAVCSATPTGFRSKLLKSGYYAQNLTIENIENKYDDRFIDGLLIRFGTNQTIVGG